MDLTTAQRKRLQGALVGTAVGDALGAPLEFGPVVDYPQAIAMGGGGGHDWAPGEWTDDTSMAVIIARAAAEHGGLDTAAALDAIAVGFEAWARTAPDVGIQTRTVLHAAGQAGALTGTSLAAAARAYAEHTPHHDGNGSLMRTAPVVLVDVGDAAHTAELARVVSALTHPGDDAADACVLWCLGLRAGALHGSLQAAREGMLEGLDFVAAGRRDRWRQRLAEAEAGEPWDFPKNGWVVHALQAAWSAITCAQAHAAGDGANAAALPETFAARVDHAVRCGWDTDTVAAIAGAMLGAIHGVDAIPADWQELVHGWPGLRGDDLRLLADTIIDGKA